MHFDSAPYYHVGYCGEPTVIPLDKLGTNKNRIWTIELDSTRVKLFCNGIQIFDYDPQLSESQECREKWSLGASILKFGDNSEEMDNASDFFREYTTGKERTKVVSNNKLLYRPIRFSTNQNAHMCHVTIYKTAIS